MAIIRIRIRPTNQPINQSTNQSIKEFAPDLFTALMPNDGETAGNYVEWTKEMGGELRAGAMEMRQEITLRGQRKHGGELRTGAMEMRQEITLKGQRKRGGELQGRASQLLTKRSVCVIIYRGILRKYLSVSILEGNL